MEDEEKDDDESDEDVSPTNINKSITTDNTEITATTKLSDTQDVNFDEIDDFVP